MAFNGNRLPSDDGYDRDIASILNERRRMALAEIDNAPFSSVRSLVCGTTSPLIPDGSM